MQLENGSELLEGLGGTQANSLFDAELQRRNLTDSFEFEQIRFDGMLLGGEERGSSLRKCVRIVKFVEIAVDGIQPSGGNLVIKLVVGGILLSQQYSYTNQTVLVPVVGNGNGGQNPFEEDAEHDPLSGPGIIVAAETTLAARVITANGAADARVTIHSRRRIV